MADQTTDHDTADKVAHRGTYDSFMTTLKWGVAVVSVVLIAMAVFLA